MRMQTWRLAQTMAGGDAARIDTSWSAFDQSLTLLRSGDPSRPLFVPHDARIAGAPSPTCSRAGRRCAARWVAPSAAAASADATAAQAEAFVERIDAFVVGDRAPARAPDRGAERLPVRDDGAGASSARWRCCIRPTCSSSTRWPACRPGWSASARATWRRASTSPRDDEFGALSAGFNRMAQTLQGLYQNLEAKVQEKTLRLETERARLAALYEAAAFVATRQHAGRSWRRALPARCGAWPRADASAVRWSDESNQRYLLLASDCLPQAARRRRALRRRRATASADSAQGRRQTRVIPIRSHGPPDLPGHCDTRRLRDRDQRAGAPAGTHGRRAEPVLPHARHAESTTIARCSRPWPATWPAPSRALRAGALRARGRGGRGTRPAGARTARLDRAGPVVPEDPGRPAARRPAARSDAARDRARARRTGRRRARKPVGRARTAGALPHPHQRRGHRARAAHHAAEVRAPDRPAPRTWRSRAMACRWPPDVQVQVLHVVQEALSNVRKHAQAREVWVEVQQAPRWRVEVRDDGRGFAEDAWPRPTRPTSACASCANGRSASAPTVEVAVGAGLGHAASC